MAEFDARGMVEAALVALGEGLGPVVAARFHELAPTVTDWTDILERKDRQAGRGFGRYNPRDISLLLRAFTESFGSLGYPFAGVTGRQAQNWASELRTVRNKWAHNEEFSIAETYRALDSAEMLLRELAAEAQAEDLHALKTSVLAAMAAESGVPASAPAVMSDTPA